MGFDGTYRRWGRQEDGGNTFDVGLYRNWGSRAYVTLVVNDISCNNQDVVGIFLLNEIKALLKRSVDCIVCDEVKIAQMKKVDNRTFERGARFGCFSRGKCVVAAL